MKSRILTACVLLPLLLLVYFGGLPLKIGCLLISALGLHEIFKCLEAKGGKPSFACGYISLAVLYIPYIFLPNGRLDINGYIAFFVVFSLILSMIGGFKVKERKEYDVMLTFFGIMYTVLLPLYVSLMSFGNYSPWLWLIFIVAFGTDIFAYFVGMAIGKHKMCPNLSPKKSWEGAIGGLIFAVGFTLLYAYFTFGGSPMAMKWAAVFGVIGSVMSQCGDLAASAIKRQMDIKDYGKLLPGHGGILDRFDSILFTAPTLYYLITLMGMIEG